jgi:hypothetical protein
MSGPDRLPPGWPPQVRPPGAPDWERSATGWLLDQCPPEYRGYPVITRNPPALAWLAGHHVDAEVNAVRSALARVRGDLGDRLAVRAVAALIEALQAEQARLIGVRRAVGLVDEALQGHRYIPRM